MHYLCETTVIDFTTHHELRIDHVYETFYTLVMGLLMYIRTHPDVPDETVKDIIASTLHIEATPPSTRSVDHLSRMLAAATVYCARRELEGETGIKERSRDMVV